MTRINAILHDHLSIFMILSPWILLTMRNVSGEILQKIHFVFNNIFFQKKKCLLWNNVEKYCTAWQATYDNMAQARCMLDTQDYKYTHTGCVILTAFPLQQWLHERTSLLRNMYIARLLLLSSSYKLGWI